MSAIAPKNFSMLHSPYSGIPIHVEQWAEKAVEEGCNETAKPGIWTKPFVFNGNRLYCFAEVSG